MNKWKHRPPGSNWGDFGPEDQLGRLNWLTDENTLKAAREIKVGKRFCLSLPLNVPATNATNPRRHPPRFQGIVREGHVAFNLPMDKVDPGNTGVGSDEAVTLWSQHSSQWDAFGHMGALFDANGDGVDEPIQYNGHSVLNEQGEARWGEVGAWNCGIEHMARHGFQARGVLVNLKRHYGERSHAVGYEDLMRILESDGVEVEQGDVLCIYTGYADLLLSMGENVTHDLPRTHCSAFDGWDDRLLQWIDDSGVVALTCDNRAVEFEHPSRKPGVSRGPALPIHELCLFKLGIHLGEMWYFSEIAKWLEANQRYRFFLSAPPLHLPGAVGSPANGIGTV
ncbi:MAG: cyclase family protein [Gammaproteobacteria bacterium]|nr:cyclase family protein [Gammaproteobacteria bacterium]